MYNTHDSEIERMEGPVFCVSLCHGNESFSVDLRAFTTLNTDVLFCVSCEKSAMWACFVKAHFNEFFQGIEP